MTTPTAPTFSTANSAAAEQAIKTWLAGDSYLAGVLGTSILARGPAQARTVPRLEIEATET